MFDQEYDVVVLGTGAAGLTAAVTAHEHGATVGVFEKADKIGGTSAWSGGMMWIPNNPLMAEAGIDDSTEEALTYLDSLSLDMIEPELARALIESGPEMIDFLRERTPVQFRIVAGFPDYHPERPGGKVGGARSELARRAVRDERGAGLALIGRLLRACLDRGIEPQPDMRARELIVED